MPGHPPDHIAHFRIVSVLGSGAMGVVYRAVDDDLGRRVAIKRVSPNSRSKGRQLRLLREAQTMARLSHPNVVQVYEVGIVGEDLFIAMELVDGPDLATLLAEEQRSWQAILRIFIQAGRGICAAHAVGLVHRDFKPANVLVGDDGRARVADFGLACLSEESDTMSGLPSPLASTLTATGAVVGTPAYMAPELLRGGAADSQSDLYSFCAALYGALYGQRPFVGDTPQDLLLDMQTRDLREPPRSRSVPAWVLQILIRGLCEREQRWPDMNALLEALDLDARQRRHRRRLGAVSIGLAAAAGLSLSLWTRPAAKLCGDDDTLTSVWTPSTRDQLRQALTKPGQATASVTAATVLRRLDAYQEQWQGERRNACEATRVRQEQSEALMDARIRCLDGRAQEFSALLRVLLSGDDEVLRRAVPAIGELPEIGRCADVDYVSAEHPPPESAADAVAIEAARGQLARALALERAGRFADALEVLDSGLSDRADSIHYRPFIAEVALARGTVLDDLGEAEAAATALEAAYYGADACGAFSLAESAALRLVHVVGYRQAHAAEAERWARLAEAKIEYTGDEPGRVRLALNRGETHEAADNFEAALASYSRALTLHQRSAAPDPLKTAEILDNLGLAELKLTRYDSAREHLQAALSIWTAEVGEHHPLVGRGYNSLGILYSKSGRYSDAAEAFERVVTIWTISKGPESDDVAAMHNNLGVVYRLSGDIEGARANLRRALTIRERKFGPDHESVAKVLGNMGSLELSEGDAGAAYDLYGRALAIYENRISPESLQIAIVLQGVALSAIAIGRADEAVKILPRVITIRELHLPPGHTHTIHAHTSLAEALLVSDQIKEAREALDRALALARGRPPEEASNCRIALVEARILAAEDRLPKARKQALSGLSDCRENDPENLPRLKDLETWLAEHPS